MAEHGQRSGIFALYNHKTSARDQHIEALVDENNAYFERCWKSLSENKVSNL